MNKIQSSGGVHISPPFKGVPSARSSAEYFPFTAQSMTRDPMPSQSYNDLGSMHSYETVNPNRSFGNPQVVPQQQSGFYPNFPNPQGVDFQPYDINTSGPYPQPPRRFSGSQMPQLYGNQPSMEQGVDYRDYRNPYFDESHLG
jgi:hypothetical protein